MFFMKKIIFISSLLMIFPTFSANARVFLSPQFFQGKYKISQKNQNFIENFKPTNDKRDIITKINFIMESLPAAKREFFIQILNMTMNVNMNKPQDVMAYLNETENLTKMNITLPQAEKKFGSFVKNIFSTKDIHEYFQEALAGDTKALEAIAKKAGTLKSVSDGTKREILENLEKATLAMVKKIDEKMKPMYEAVPQLDEDSQVPLEKQIEQQQQHMARLKAIYDSQNYLVLKHCQDILNALEPMIDKKFQHFMLTYDRTQNSALINLLDFRLIDLSKIKTEQELDETIHNIIGEENISEIVANNEIKSPKHAETKRNFPSLVKQEILEHHPDLVKIAEDAGKKILKTHDDVSKAEIMKSFSQKPRWQKEAISVLMNRYIQAHEQQADHVLHGNKSMPEFAR